MIVAKKKPAKDPSTSVSPAPWMVDEYGDHGLAVYSADWAEGETDDTPVCREVNGIGNAKLIAAAPDLLVACLKVLEEFESGTLFQQRDNGEPTAIAKRSLKQLTKELRTAVDKASL